MHSGALCGRSGLVCETHLALEPSAFDTLSSSANLSTGCKLTLILMTGAGSSCWVSPMMSVMVSSLRNLLRKEVVVGWRWMIQADHTLRQSLTLAPV